MNSLENICFVVAIGTAQIANPLFWRMLKVLGNGIAIAWWRKALKGSSIVDLHRSWVFSTSFKGVVSSVRYFNIIALAALAAKLTMIDSSLMQRATSTYMALESPRVVSNVTGFVNLTFPVTGTVAGVQQQPGLLMHWMGGKQQPVNGLFKTTPSLSPILTSGHCWPYDPSP
jgi:hypothetical protein